jgi:hypothetical protein
VAARPTSFIPSIAAALSAKTIMLMQSEIPVWDLMREDERGLGHVVIFPGKADWLPVEDWDPTVVVSLDVERAEVRLVAIAARNPGHGAFRRLLLAIALAGYSPVVVCPSDKFRATLRRWGWSSTTPIGLNNEPEEQWRMNPPIAEPFP